jgi:hypothetical protein
MPRDGKAHRRPPYHPPYRGKIRVGSQDFPTLGGKVAPAVQPMRGAKLMEATYIFNPSRPFAAAVLLHGVYERRLWQTDEWGGET